MLAVVEPPARFGSDRHYGESAVGGVAFVGGITKLGTAEAASVLAPEFLALVPSFFSADVEESANGLRSQIRMCVLREPAAEDLCLMLGYAVSVSPVVRQALLSRSVDNDDLLPRLRAPLLIVHGAHDAIVNAVVVERHRALVSHAETAIIPDAGHAPFWDNAPAFNARLRTFCDQRARERSEPDMLTSPSSKTSTCRRGSRRPPGERAP